MPRYNNLAPGADGVPWPPTHVRAMIEKMRRDGQDPDWGHLSDGLISIARQQRARFNDVPEDPGDIAQYVLLSLRARDSLAQFGQNDGVHLTPAQRWSGVRFMAWLTMCVRNEWRMRRRATRRRVVTVDLTTGEKGAPECFSYLDQALALESLAESAFMREVVALLVTLERDGATGRKQAQVFRLYLQAKLDGAAFDPQDLAERFGVSRVTLRVWIMRVRKRLQAHLRSGPLGKELLLRQFFVKNDERIEQIEQTEQRDDADPGDPRAS